MCIGLLSKTRVHVSDIVTVLLFLDWLQWVIYANWLITAMYAELVRLIQEDIESQWL